MWYSAHDGLREGSAETCFLSPEVNSLTTLQGLFSCPSLPCTSLRMVWKEPRNWVKSWYEEKVGWRSVEETNARFTFMQLRRQREVRRIDSSTWSAIALYRR